MMTITKVAGEGAKNEVFKLSSGFRKTPSRLASLGGSNLPKTLNPQPELATRAIPRSPVAAGVHCQSHYGVRTFTLLLQRL
jgi:hypothetical protein